MIHLLVTQRESVLPCLLCLDIDLGGRLHLIQPSSYMFKQDILRVTQVLFGICYLKQPSESASSFFIVTIGQSIPAVLFHHARIAVPGVPGRKGNTPLWLHTYCITQEK